MSAYMVFNLAVTNHEGFQDYGAAAGATLAPYGGELLFADRDSEPIEGSPGHVTAIVRFDSKEAARAWYQSPEYQAVRPLRTKNAEGIVMLCEAQ